MYTDELSIPPDTTDDSVHFDISVNGDNEDPLSSPESDVTEDLEMPESILVEPAFYDPDYPLSSSSDYESDDECIEFSQKLCAWVAEYCITHRATNALLRLLLDEGLPVPLDRRTLCESVRSVHIGQICGGDYIYMNLKSSIENEFEIGHFCSNVILDFGADGIPIYKSRKSELWPIMARFGSCDPFLVSCYYGRGKPNSAESFLEDLINELDGLIGIEHKYLQQKYDVSVRSFICDAPARSFLKGIVSHTGYFSCERCTIKGSRDAKRVVFDRPELVEKRTNELFRSFSYNSSGKCHQHENSPLIRVSSLNLISGFILDSMHMVYLGVVRRILYSFKGRIKGINKTKLSSQLLNQINIRLGSCNGKLPSEFNRQPRSLEDLDYWKATELRSFLLYTGMVVLKGIVPDKVYEHFICLCLAVTLMSGSNEDRRNGSLAFCRELINFFISNAAKLYGSPFVVYNIHSLQHIPDDVEVHNVSLQEIDAFCFENKLKELKRAIRGPQNPLSQVYKRIIEKKQHCKTTRKRQNCVKVSSKAKDACFETDDKILFVKRIAEEKCTCQAYSKRLLQNLFTKPKESKDFGIFYIPAKSKCTVVQMWKSHLVNKCISLPHKGGQVVVPMVHL